MTGRARAALQSGRRARAALQSGERARVGLAVAVGLGLTVAVPAGLLALAGSPLPTTIPTSAEIGRALTSGDISEAFLVKALALLAWLAWAQLLVALGVEAVAAARGRPAPKAPVVGAIQALAAAAIAVVVPLLAGLPRTGGVVAAEPLSQMLERPQPPAGAPRGGASASEAPDPPPAAPPAPASAPMPAAPTVVVEGRATFWSLAERHLGDGRRWKDLYEINAGREQSDGSVIDRPDVGLRHGWHVVLPAGATPDDPVAPSSTDPVATDPVATDPAATDPVATDPAATDPAATDAGSDAEHDSADEGGRTAESFERLVELTESARQAAKAADAEQRAAASLLTPTPTPTRVAGDPLPEPPAAPDLDEGLDAPPPVRNGSVLDLLSGAGLLTGGVVWSLDRLRRRRERQRIAPELDDEPATNQSHLEASVRAAARLDLTTFVDLALRAWAARLDGAGRARPPVVGVNVASELSLLFATRELDPVPGFAVEDEGFSWVTSMERNLGELERVTGAPPLPALFTLGHTDHSQVLLNAQHVSAISVVGTGQWVADTLHTIALELATGPWSTPVRVVAVGLTADLSAVPGITIVDTPEDAITEVRSHEQGPGPVVVVAAGLSSEEAGHLCEVASSRPDRVTLIAGGELHHAEWRIEVSDDEIALEPVGVRLRRHRLDRQTHAGVIELFDRATADPPEVPTVPTPPRDRRLSVVARPLSATSELEILEPPAVEVRVLGPVGVAGIDQEFTRRKALELVAYLACHRRGVDGDAVCEALWPDRLVSPATLHGMVSLARRTLGASAAGSFLLPHAADGIYRLNAGVGLDLERFSGLVCEADAEDGEDGERAAALLRAALELVRGRPFTVAGDEYLWVHAEALASAVTAEVADAAHRLACLYLDGRDPTGAWWATRQGLLASPGNEQLHRDRMLAADLAGNPAGVEEVMEDLCRAAEIDPSEMDGVLHPLTVDLYRRLSRRHPSRLLSRT